MTTFMHDSSKCSVCGHLSRHEILGSSNSFGYPDLDLRPAGMMRGTMAYWVQECPRCGYVASDLERATTVSREWLKSESYRTCEGHTFASALARLFYRQYLIAVAEGRANSAMSAALHAAWASDDRGDKAGAVTCRLKCLAQMEIVLAERREAGEDDENLLVKRADVMRRAGQFDEVIAAYAHVHCSEDVLNDVIAFQRAKAAAHDAARYCIGDIHGPVMVAEDPADNDDDD